MKTKLMSGLVVLFVGGAAGATFGAWWINAIGEEVCGRLEQECGEQAMPLSDCLNGRQQDLFHYGVGAMRKMKSCVAEAPHDCLSVSACIGSVDGK